MAGGYKASKRHPNTPGMVHRQKEAAKAIERGRYGKVRPKRKSRR